MVRCDVQRWDMQKQIDATRYIIPCIWHAIRHIHGYDMIPLRGNMIRDFGILSSSILIIWPAHYSLLILMSSTMSGSLYKLYSSLFHLGHQHPPSCVGPHILRNIFLIIIQPHLSNYNKFIIFKLNLSHITSLKQSK